MEKRGKRVGDESGSLATLFGVYGCTRLAKPPPFGRSDFGSVLCLLLSCYTLDSLYPVGNYGLCRASNERSFIVAQCMESVVGREAG